MIIFAGIYRLRVASIKYRIKDCKNKKLLLPHSCSHLNIKINKRRSEMGIRKLNVHKKI